MIKALQAKEEEEAEIVAEEAEVVKMAQTQTKVLGALEQKEVDRK